MSDTSPRLDLPYIQSAQAQKHVTHNEALRTLDVLVQLTVEDFAAVTPPAIPQEGKVYALGAGATDAWSDEDGKLATWVDAAWQFHVPQAGWTATLMPGAEIRAWTGAAWVPISGATDNLAGVGVNTASDLTNRLAIASPASLFSHEGAGHQVKVNKAAASDTASLLFQSNWSGRGEIGLMGNDDFGFKVSPDGSTYHDAILIDRSTGKVSFPSGANGSGSAAGALGGQVVALCGESSASLVVGEMLSMGAGGTQAAGAAMPFPGKVVAASMTIAGGSAGLNTISMAIDTVEQTSFQASVTYSGSGVETGYADYSSAPLAFAAGDALGMMVNTSSGASDVTVTFFVIFD